MKTAFEVSRKDYLDLLKDKRHNGLIKIITGVRRSGKSYLLFNLFKRSLLEEGVKEDHIISLELDHIKNRKYLSPEVLYDYVAEQIVDDELYFILLDEIQLVSDFESVLNGFLHLPNVDVYVTGSNSKFLSSDIITEFRGRGDEIRVYPFSFEEIYTAKGGDKWELWAKYCNYGGMPQILNMSSNKEIENYLKNLFSQVYINDIINRYNLRGKSEIDTLCNVMSSSIASLTNPKRISDTFTSAGLKLSQSTVSRYLDYFQDSFLLSQAMRYDVKGRKYIGTPSKYYFVDTGLRNARLNFRQNEENHLMENIIYNELLRRGFSVDVGVVEITENGIRKQLEVDFVANMGSNRYYIQSAFELPTEEKITQERRPLISIGDSFRKIIIQRNPTEPWYDNDGVLWINILDFLLKKDL